MAYTINRYVYDSAKLKGLKKLLHELETQYSKTAWFAGEHSRLLREIMLLEDEMKLFEEYTDRKNKGG